MTSFIEGFTTYRTKEPYELDGGDNVSIDGQISQYLTGYQLKGIKLLYKNYQKGESSILNDESGLGKRVQITAFLNAVCHAFSDTVIIFCSNTARELQWNYHLAVFAPNVKRSIIDVSALTISVTDSQRTPGGMIYITTYDAAKLDYYAELECLDCDLLVMDEGDQFCTTEQICNLADLRIEKKIVMSTDNIMMNLEHFFEIIKFCDRLSTFNSTTAPKKITTVREFSMKHGAYCDKTLSSRDLNIRTTNMINLCRDFYIRRHRLRVPNRLPLIESKMYESNFNRWKSSNDQNQTLEALPKTPQPNANNDNIHSGQIISQDLFSFTETIEPNKQYETDSDSRMSPLVYECSETENDENDETLTRTQTQTGEWATEQSDSDFEIPNGQTRFRRLSPSPSLSSLSNDEEEKIISPRMTRTRAKTLLETSTVLTRSKQKAKPNATKGRQYKQLNVQTKDLSNKKKKVKEPNSKQTKNTQPRVSTPSKRLPPPRRSSCHSDVEFISQRLSPIYVPDSSESVFRLRNCGSTKTNPPKNKSNRNMNSTELRLSPDIFASINGSQSFANVDHEQNDSTIQTTCNLSSASTVKNHSNGRCSINISSDSSDSTETNLLKLPNLNGSKSFNTTTDIFEITRNNVFHNILQIRSDQKVSPFRRKPENNGNQIDSNKDNTCFDEFRIVMPKLNMSVKSPNKSNKSVYRKTPAPNPNQSLNVRIIDITESEKIPSKLPTRRSLEHAFDKVGRSKNIENNLEKTPPRREMPTTPTTRSCLKRAHQKERLSTGWLSKRKSPREQSPQNVTATPRSCRRLDTSFPSTSKSTEIGNGLPFKPRLLFGQVRAGRRITRSQSVGINNSPIIVFSSDEEC